MQKESTAQDLCYQDISYQDIRYHDHADTIQGVALIKTKNYGKSIIMSDIFMPVLFLALWIAMSFQNTYIIMFCVNLFSSPRFLS